MPNSSPETSEQATAAFAQESERASTSLLEANRLLTMAEEMAHVGHWQFDQLSGLGYFSDEARRIFGFEDGQRLTREPVLAAYHPDDRERVKALLAEHVAAGTRFEYPARIVRPSGEVRAVLVRGRCDRDQAGTSVVTFGTVLDVTEIRQTEQRLRETSALLTTTLDTMDQGLMMVDGQGIVVVANRRAAELLDLDPAFLARRPHYTEVRRAQAEAGEYATTEPAFQAWVGSTDLAADAPVYERVRPNGTVLEVRSVPLADGGVLRTYTDVTARRQAETRLREKTALLDATLENMDQGLMMIDADGIVQVCNQRAIRLLDLPEPMMRAQPSFEAVRRYQLRQQDFVRSDEALRDWVVAGGLATGLHAYERERPDGSVLEIRTVPLADGSAVRTYTDITQRKQAEARIAHMARHDALTDLPNRTLFHERLEQRLAKVRRYGGRCAVLCLDLDRFKVVNDTLGHLAGDALLRAVAQRLRAAVRKGDTVARLGGDEFAVLVARAGRHDRVEHLAARLIAAVQAPVTLGGQSVEVGLSIGVAFAPEHGTSAEAMVKCADVALYQAKADGRGTYRVFAPGMDAQAAERRALERDLRRAIAAGDLALHYQPQVRSATGEIVGFEALVRWTHPTRGVISPAIFVALAEETGLIGLLGAWVLRAACREAARWSRPLKIAVNLSPRQFAQADLPERVLEILTETGLSPTRLELEVTETVIINDVARALAILRRLKALGIHISMDDFGTGYSSLATLQAFPFDKIKIDRAFVGRMDESPQAATIVRAVLGLGRSLGMGVVAEGVETPEQLRFLADAACDEVQGYLTGRPQPIAAFTELLGGLSPAEDASRAA